MSSDIFLTTLSRMGFLFLIVAVGFVLKKTKVADGNFPKVLSRLESTVFIPALFLTTFMDGFTIEKMQAAGGVMLTSLIVEAIVIALSFLVIRLFTKDAYLQKIHQYALCFANFAYFGNAIVSALFPELFADYLLYTLVLWVGIAVWGAPMLIKEEHHKKGFAGTMLRLLNPMMVAAILGMLLGLFEVKFPSFIKSALDGLSACMSSVAMLLSGMVFASMNFKKVFRHPSVYVQTVIRLVVIPLLFLVIAKLIRLPEEYVLLGTASMAMPVGLNVIVIPAASGDVPEQASGMVLLSHILSAVTIPLIFALVFLWK